MLPNIQPSQPVVIPAKVYDKFWVEEVIISAPNVNGDATGRVLLKKFGVFDGLAEMMPGDNGTWITIENLLSKTESDNDLANIVQSLLLYIQKVGIEQGVVADPETII